MRRLAARLLWLHLKIKRLLSCNRANLDGFAISLKSKRISDYIAGRIIDGTYDYADRQIIRKYVRPGDLVVELGGGCGVTAMVAKKAAGAEGRVISVEADPEMCSIACDHFAKNGMLIELHQGAAMASPGLKLTELFVGREFWDCSVIRCADDVRRKIHVPAIYAAGLLEHASSARRVLICDVEGYETELLVNDHILELCDVIIAEVHNYGIAQKASANGIGTMMNTISSRGFFVCESRGHTWVWAKKRGCE